MFEPAYLKLYESGELDTRIQKLKNILYECTLCPRKCRVNRLKGEKGYCEAGDSLEISSYFPHFGEERPLVGRNGSGTIFFTHCNLLCTFCQNYELSHLGEGYEISENKLAQIMMHLQNLGCHNINLVTPTHFTAQIIAALPAAIELGLKLPIVYNCGGYESLEIIMLLGGIVDIYMPDFKFADNRYAQRYTNAADYFAIVRNILKEMFRQVGNLQVDEYGIACRGLLIRHLVMPNDVAGTEAALTFIHSSISANCYVNVMNQYSPHFRAKHESLIGRSLKREEYERALSQARKLGLKLL